MMVTLTAEIRRSGGCSRHITRSEERCYQMDRFTKFIDTVGTIPPLSPKRSFLQISNSHP